MSYLASALNWYHKKIGAYDKELWEKSVDQRILRGVCAIPKKTTRIKTELIDVDLVRGSAFAKAKPQHSWIAATISGLKRVLLMPFFFSWWKLQTNSLVSCVFIILYFLQLIATYLYFTADEKDFSDVPVSEILTPTAMTCILGIVHSQIVATFTNKKSRKHVRCHDKRRRIKRAKKPADFDKDSKSSPESASDEKHDILDSPRTNGRDCDNSESQGIDYSSSIICHPCGCKRLSKTGQQLRFSFEDNTLIGGSQEESGVEDTEFVQPSENCINCDAACKPNTFSNDPSLSTAVHSSARCELSCHANGTGINDSSLKDELDESVHGTSHSSSKANSSSIPNGMVSRIKIPDSRSFVEIDDGHFSSEEEFFVTRKSSYVKDRWDNCSLEAKNMCTLPKTCSKTHSLKSLSAISRRYSDCGPSLESKVPQRRFLSLQDHHHSVGSLKDDALYCKMSQSERREVVSEDVARVQENRKRGRESLMRSIKLPVNIKNFSSSCESGGETTTSPNTPSKPHPSDLEWPLITNTDCNSDSTDCSTQCSEGNASDVSPSENPFAWEIQEPSKKLSNVGYVGLDKVSCTIWEQSECKKADLTALDISTAIIQKVDSSQYSPEYLYMGLFFSFVLSALPLLFRLRNGIAGYVIHDVTTDVMTLTVPTSEDVVRMTDGLLGITLGPRWRVKFVVFITMVARFTLCLAYFFLLSVAEKTFKQRFLYAKHFCYLTSSRRAKRLDLPHFRLNKVRNIKIWLSIRSYMKKLGPQRSVDVIVSIAFLLEVFVVSFLCIQLLKESGQFADKLHCWELLFWTLALGIYLLRFMVIGAKINKKYRNLSVLITEQINLYLHMEQKPHKKEELMLANNVLKLAADLLKELESPFKISGLCANSYLYNITKVIVLSAFSAVLTDVLGFKLKLYKIKLK